MIIEAKKNPNGMNCIEVIEVIQTLAKSQGFYSRLYSAIMGVAETDKDRFDDFCRELEKQNFKDPLDVVLFFES